MTALAGCENVRALHSDKLAQIEKVAVISRFGDEFEMRKVGITVFQNTYSRVRLNDFSFARELEEEAVSALSELGYEGIVYEDLNENIQVSYNPLLITDTRKLGNAPVELLSQGVDILIVIDEYLHNRGDAFPRNEVGLFFVESNEAGTVANLYVSYEFSIYSIPGGKRIFYETESRVISINLDSWTEDFNGFSVAEKEKIIREAQKTLKVLVKDSILNSLKSE